MHFSESTIPMPYTLLACLLLKDNQGIRPSQHGFMKGRSCLTNLVSFHDQVTHLVDEGKAVDVVYLVFSKALTLFLTASSWRNQLPMVWMGVLFAE